MGDWRLCEVKRKSMHKNCQEWHESQRHPTDTLLLRTGPHLNSSNVSLCNSVGHLTSVVGVGRDAQCARKYLMTFIQHNNMYVWHNILQFVCAIPERSAAEQMSDIEDTSDKHKIISRYWRHWCSHAAAAWLPSNAGRHSFTTRNGFFRVCLVNVSFSVKIVHSVSKL